MKKGRKKGVIVVLCVVAAALLLSTNSFYRVGQGEEALVLTFGHVTDTKGPGLYWKIPLCKA